MFGVVATPPTFRRVTPAGDDTFGTDAVDAAGTDPVRCFNHAGAGEAVPFAAVESTLLALAPPLVVTRPRHELGAVDVGVARGVVDGDAVEGSVVTLPALSLVASVP